VIQAVKRTELIPIIYNLVFILGITLVNLDKTFEKADLIAPDFRALSALYNAQNKFKLNNVVDFGYILRQLSFPPWSVTALSQDENSYS